jgi:ribosomal protein L11 methyltransferase
MNYYAYRFHCNPRQPLSEILVSELADIGFESFVDTAEGVDAFVPENLDNEPAVREVADNLAYLGTMAYNRDFIPDQNWNATWEADYPVVTIGNRCIVRAPFHNVTEQYDLDLLITPQMSFGTGHHATTRHMLTYLLDEPLSGKAVLDMGAGTGVLAIAAMKLGAASAWAIDVDDWACRNAQENVALNHVNIRVDKGDATSIIGHFFDLILANINKNVLLSDISAYAKCLSPGGILMMSGFFDADVAEIISEADKYGLRHHTTRCDDHWAALKLIKE